MSVDRYLDRVRTPRYNCAAFARDVWLDLTGEDIGNALAGLLGRLTGARLSREAVRAFRELPTPVSPCLVTFQRPRGPLHVGVYIRGRVLHLVGTGVQYQPIAVAARTFKTVRFCVLQ